MEKYFLFPFLFLNVCLASSARACPVGTEWRLSTVIVDTNEEKTFLLPKKVVFGVGPAGCDFSSPKEVPGSDKVPIEVVDVTCDFGSGDKLQMPVYSDQNTRGRGRFVATDSQTKSKILFDIECVLK